jgi:hypothetical protein
VNAKLGASAAVVGLLLYAHGHHHLPRIPAVTAAAHVRGGTLGCSGLEQLWEQAGGSQGAAVTAASVAMAESSGQQYAASPTSDVGYWQINAPVWGSLATTDPLGNARAAVRISHDGSDWSPWVTYQTGAYAGRC